MRQIHVGCRHQAVQGSARCDNNDFVTTLFLSSLPPTPRLILDVPTYARSAILVSFTVSPGRSLITTLRPVSSLTVTADGPLYLLLRDLLPPRLPPPPPPIASTKMLLPNPRGTDDAILALQ